MNILFTPNKKITMKCYKCKKDKNEDDIDHIKPVSKFNLKEEKELKQCCHYTNLQPLLEKDNLSKSNKWSEEDEINWRNNIIQKDLL